EFDLIELGHGIRLSLMPGIQKMFDAGQVRFSSLHNFCPLPVEVMMASPDCYQFSAVSSEERERAVKQTLQTIDFAARLDAPFVVLHLGEVNMAPVTDHLIKLATNGAYLSRKYVRLKVGAVQKREKIAPAYLQRVKDCPWPAKDHETPFTGDVIFEKLVPLFPTNCLFVWEMSPNKPADAIRHSVDIWKERFGE